jgi:hypothetical protein
LSIEMNGAERDEAAFGPRPRQQQQGGCDQDVHDEGATLQLDYQKRREQRLKNRTATKEV